MKKNGNDGKPLNNGVTQSVAEARAALAEIQAHIDAAIMERDELEGQRALIAHDQAGFSRTFERATQLDQEIQRLNILRQNAAADLQQAEEREAEVAAEVRRRKISNLSDLRREALEGLDKALAVVRQKCESLVEIENQIGLLGVTAPSVRFIANVAVKNALRQFVEVATPMSPATAASFGAPLRDPQAPAPPRQPAPPPRAKAETPSEPTAWQQHLDRAAGRERERESRTAPAWVGR